MGFKMKGMTFGAGTGSEKPKTISDIDRDASSEVAMDSAMDKKMQAPLKAVNMTKGEMEKMQADIKAKAEQIKTDKGSFGDAFNTARSAGKKEFTYKGKKYHTRTKEEEAKSGGDDNKSMKKETRSAEVDRPDYQKRRQQARLDRRRARGAGTSDIFDIRTDKKEARMKYGRGSEEFKKYKQELKDAKKSARQERRDNR